MRSCVAGCRRAHVVPSDLCRCICEGINHGSEPRLPGFVDVEQGAKDGATKDERDVQHDWPFNSELATEAVSLTPAQVYRGIRHLAEDARRAGIPV